MPKVSPINIYTRNFEDEFSAVYFENEGMEERFVKTAAGYFLNTDNTENMPYLVSIDFKSRFSAALAREADCIVLSNGNIKDMEVSAFTHGGGEFGLGFANVENNRNSNLLLQSNTVFSAERIVLTLNGVFDGEDCVKIGKLKIMRRVMALENALTSFRQKDDIKKSQYYSLCGKLYLWKERQKRAGTLSVENLSFENKEILEKCIEENSVLNFQLFPDEDPFDFLEAAAQITGKNFDRSTGLCSLEIELTEV